MYSLFTNFGVALHLHEQGMIEDDLLQFFEEGIVAMMERPGIHAWWNTDEAKMIKWWEHIERRRLG